MLQEGLVLASDTRTNAGVDQVAVFPKMHRFVLPGERVIVLLTAGNLAITQSVVSRLQEQIKQDKAPHLFSASSMFDVAGLVGDQVREVYSRDAEHLKQHHAEFHASILLAGQIKGERPRLFNIYNAGNFIEASEETPYFQIGETKYGKPIIDRVIQKNTSIMDAVKCILISFDSTIRSNISVAAPIDLLVYRTDSLNADCYRRVSDQDSYFDTLRKGWSEGLKQVFQQLPAVDWFAK
jgi:putative proteasome-type protease